MSSLAFLVWSTPRSGVDMVKAAYITQFGGGEVVTVGKLPGHAQPKAGEGEVLIKVHAAGGQVGSPPE